MGMPQALTDEELLAGISRGEASSLAALYDRYAPRAFGLILQFLQNQTDAEDVVQETFLQVWQQAGRFRRRQCCPATARRLEIAKITAGGTART